MGTAFFQSRLSVEEGEVELDAAKRMELKSVPESSEPFFISIVMRLSLLLLLLKLLLHRHYYLCRFLFSQRRPMPTIRPGFFKWRWATPEFLTTRGHHGASNSVSTRQDMASSVFRASISGAFGPLRVRPPDCFIHLVVCIHGVCFLPFFLLLVKRGRCSVRRG